MKFQYFHMYHFRRFRTRVFMFRYTLYAINFLLSLMLILTMLKEDEQISVKPFLSFLENYQNHISYAMEIFDFMHNQRLSAKPIPPPEDQENLPIVSYGCQPWFWDRGSIQNRNFTAAVHWNNILWQSVSNAQIEIYLYSAFYDDRPNVIFPRASASIQLIGMVWRRLNEDIYCQIWMRNDSQWPFVVKALSREIWQRAWDPRDRFYSAILFTCPLPSHKFPIGTPVPTFVSMTTGDLCAKNQIPSNYLPIRTHTSKIDIKKKKHKQHTVVCVKGMDFLEDLSMRFVEWLELNYHVGADKVVIYTYAVHPRMRKVIEYYEKHRPGRFEHIPLTIPGHAPNAPLHRSKFIKRNRQQKRRHELIPYNDCLYRHIGTHEYVLIVDVDELIVPLKHDNWKEMLNEVKSSKTNEKHQEINDSWTAFSIANAFFFDNLTTIDQKQKDLKTIPSHLHIMTHDRRSRKISPPGIYGKSFMDTNNVATVFNHFPLHKHRRQPDAVLRSTVYVDPNLARKNHYKAVCPIESREECPDLYSRTVKDDSAARYAISVMPRIQDTISELGIQSTGTH